MATIRPGEIFHNPIVQQVTFQVQFPNLFYIEQKLGDLQVEIMGEFPDSELLMRSGVMVIAGVDEQTKIPGPEAMEKIWVFKNDKGVKVEVKKDALTILSTAHKSYRDGDTPFRAVIERMLGVFFRHVPVPSVTRLGLRYVDLFPFETFSTAEVTRHFDTVMRLDRFGVETSKAEMTFVGLQERAPNRMVRYVEQLQPPEPGPGGHKGRMVLDFDGSATNLLAKDVLQVTDELHGHIRREFESSVKDPVLEWMRRPRA